MYGASLVCMANRVWTGVLVATTTAAADTFPPLSVLTVAGFPTSTPTARVFVNNRTPSPEAAAHSPAMYRDGSNVPWLSNRKHGPPPRAEAGRLFSRSTSHPAAFAASYSSSIVLVSPGTGNR